MKRINSFHKAALLNSIKRMDSPWKIGMLGFAAITILNLGCLMNPPYWDDILGLHNQAIWLYKNNFNIVKLWSCEQFAPGGSNPYPFGVMPYVYGMLYSLMAPVYVHITGHLFNIGCIASAFALFYKIIRKYSSFPAAVLWSAAALCEPVIAGSTASLGQECPLLLAAALAVYCLTEKRYWNCLLFMLLAFFIKLSGILLFYSMAVCLIAFCFYGNRFFNFRKNALWLAFFFMFFMLAVFIHHISSLLSGGFLAGRGSIVTNITVHFRFLLPFSAVMLVSVILAACWYVIKKFKCLKGRAPTGIEDEAALLFFLLTFIAGFWSAYVLFCWPLPRYSAIIVFPMFCFLGVVFSTGKLSNIAASLFLASGLVIWQCNLLPALPPFISRSGEYLERSREYLHDLELNQALCNTLEARHFNQVICAKWPFVQMLTVPELGYVKKPLSGVVSIMHVPLYASVQRLPPGKVPKDAIYIYARNWIEVSGYVLAPYKGDTLLYQYGVPPAVVAVYIKNAERKLPKY